MNFQKANKQLKKIQKLFSAFEDQEKLSRIEHDLLLSYIRDLYETVAIAEGKKDKKASKNGKGHSDQIRKEYQQPVAKPIEKQVKTEVPKPEPAQEAPAIEVKPAVEEAKISEEILALFTSPEVSELSEKLSLTPIKDLKKAMGVNEWIFTQNELFGGKADLFTETVEALNKMSNFDDACTYLAGGVATDLDWAEEKRKKKAEKFIQLVRRRYQ